MSKQENEKTYVVSRALTNPAVSSLLSAALVGGSGLAYTHSREGHRARSMLGPFGASRALARSERRIAILAAAAGLLVVHQFMGDDRGHAVSRPHDGAVPRRQPRHDRAI
ncbi:MAG: hypothetical protein ACOYOB_19170, partial [Myxococcota bacterium]